MYVCTAAERGYACEVWRLLDPNANLIPMVRQRFFCLHEWGSLRRSKTGGAAVSSMAVAWAVGVSLGLTFIVSVYFQINSSTLVRHYRGLFEGRALVEVHDLTPC